MQKEIKAIKDKYYKIAKEINAPEELVYFYDTRQDLGYAHIEYCDGEFSYINMERGQVVKSRFTRDPDKVLFWHVKELTGEMARKYELMHRVEGQDSRRIWFDYHIELLKKINLKWGDEQKAEYDAILFDHPFREIKKEFN